MFLDLSSSDKILLTLNANNNQITYPQQSILVDVSNGKHFSFGCLINSPSLSFFRADFLNRHETMCAHVSAVLDAYEKGYRNCVIPSKFKVTQPYLLSPGCCIASLWCRCLVCWVFYTWPGGETRLCQ